MARRRINTKFLAIAVAPVVVLICMAGAYVMFPGFRQITPIRQLRHVTWLWRGTPAQHRDKGKALMDKGDYKKAAEEYKQAIQLMGNIDPEMYTALGDCFTHLVLDDPDNLKRAQVCWSQSVAMDPRYLPAQQRLLQAYIDDAEINGGGRSAQQWGAVYDAATRVMLIDPNDRGAKIAADRALIERTVLGVETDQQRVDAAAADLNDLLKQPPFNADILLYLAELKVSRSDDAARQGDRTTADQGLSDAKKLLEDTIVAHPDDWRTHYRTAQIYRMIGISERAGGSGLKSFARATEEYKKAAALIKLDDPLNGEVRGSLANFLQETGHRIDAVKILRQVLADHPDNMPARLQLAQMLGSNEKERHEAIDLLQHIPDPNPNDWIGVKAMLVRGYELTMLSTLVDFKLDALGEAKDQAEYQADLKEIDDDYAKLTATRGVSDTSIGLELAGRIQMAKGENVDAVQTLDRAIKLATAPANVNDVQRRYKLMFILARAYLNVNQTGEAKLLLTAIVHDVGDFVPARFMLTQILLREGNIDEARKHMDVLVKAMPGTPIAMRLTILSLDKDKDKAKINELYNQLPESNVEEMSDKVQVAMYLGWNDQAVKLLETIYAGNPHNDNTVLALARLYVQQGNSSKANALISDAIAKNPDHTNLKVLQAEVAGTNVGEVRRDLVEKMTDPLQKELGLFQLAMQENHPDEAATHLQAAAKIKPDDSRVLVYEFTDAIHRKDWDKATTYADALAKLNVDNADGALYRIQLARAKGDLDSAADLAQQLVLKMPEFAQSWISLGQVQSAQGKHSDAIQSFSNALQKQAQNIDALAGIIDSYYATNQTSSALQFIQLARRMYPNNAIFREAELEHETKFGDPEKVIAPRQDILNKAIANKDPHEPNDWLALGRAYLVAAKSKSNDQDAAPLLQKAKETYAQASAKWPDEFAFVQAYCDVCVQVHTPEDGEKAIQALRARPAWQNKPAPTLLLSDYYSLIGRPADQEKVLRDYLAASPQAIPVELQLATVISKQGKPDEALKILDANADDPAVRKHRVDLLIDAGRLADADKEIHEVIARTPNPGVALLLEQAFVYMKSARLTEGLGVLDKILAQDPHQFDALLYRSAIYIASGRNLDQALRDLQTLREQDPSSPDVRLQLVDAYHSKGDDDNAIREMEEAVRLQPANKEGILRLARFYSSATPPRWFEVERTLTNAQKQPQLANDLGISLAQAQMWLLRKDLSKAQDIISQAMKTAPGNAQVLRVYCQILIEGKQYRELLDKTNTMVQNKKAPWWIYQFRGQAQKGLDDKQAALDEFSAGLDLANASGDDEAVASLVRTIADQIGVEQAKIRIIGRADKGDNRWRMVMAYLNQLEGDIPSAVDWVEKVMNDPKSTPAEVESTSRAASILYLSMSPPNAAKAIEMYRKQLAHNPNDIGSLNNIACAMILPNSGYTPKDALEYSTKAYNLSEQGGTQDAMIYDTQGYIMVLNGQVDQGMNLLQQALDRKTFPDALYHMGEAYLASQTPQPGEAERVLQQALTMLDNQAKENKPIDAELKSKIENALARARQGEPTTQKSST